MGKTDSQVTSAVPKKFKGSVVVCELKFDKQIKYCSPAKAFTAGSKLLAAPPAGSVFATPVKPSHCPFQLQRIGARVLLKISSQAEAEYSHIIQSRQPFPPSCPNENSSNPEPEILTIIHVLLVSPVSRQPAFPEPGLVPGLEKFPLSSSRPAPFGSISKAASVHILLSTASEQSGATTV